MDHEAPSGCDTVDHAAIRAVVLRPEKRGTFLARHPWVLERSIIPPNQPIAAGEVVDLVLPDGRFVARGIYNPDSRIRVRLYSWLPSQPLDDAFFMRRLGAAVQLRRDLGWLDADSATRLVFSEGDMLSGLIVDKFGQHLVVQVTAKAMQTRLPAVQAWLATEFDPRSISLRVDPKVAAAEALTVADQCAYGHSPDQPFRIEQQGVHYWIDLQTAQKTGYYLDQRENRMAAAELARGRRVLDVCCYTGGFGLTCAVRGGATEIVGVDSSERSIDWARRHAVENQVPHATFHVADCFEMLQRLAAEPGRFGLVILDPPKFASHRRAIPDALCSVSSDEPFGRAVRRTGRISGHVQLFWIDLPR